MQLFMDLFKSEYTIVEDGDPGAKTRVVSEIDFNDELNRNTKNLKFLLKSALHKEIRRGDVDRALAYANTIVELYGVFTLWSYCRGIIFEETRNVALHEWFMSHKKGSRRIAMLGVYLFTTSVKKWELKDRVKISRASFLCANGIESNVKLKGKSTTLPVPNGRKLAEMIHGLDPVEMFRAHMYAYLNESKIGMKFVHDALLEELEKKLGSDVSDRYARISIPWFGDEMLIELILGAAPSTDELDESGFDEALARVKEKTVPRLREYALDIHTRIGAGLYRRNSHKLKPLVRAPFDMRWTGMMVGVMWRDMAGLSGLSHKDILDASWEDVDIPADIFSGTLVVDRLFYYGVFRR